MRIQVVIPTKNISNLRACVEALRRHEPNLRQSSIIVVDDSEGSEIAKFCNECTWLRGIRPFVYAQNCNLGLTFFEDWDGSVLLNDDALLETPGGLSMLAKFAHEHTDVGCVAPSCNITGQRLQWRKHRTPEGFRYVDTVPYICVYIPRRTFDRVGLLDERYSIDYGVEDRDHTYAMTQAGLKVAILYDVYVDHGSLLSTFRGDPKRPASFVKNQALFHEKWGIRA